MIWLHCYGERFADPAANRPKQAPRLPKEIAPSIPTGGEFHPRPSRCLTRWNMIRRHGG